MRTITPAIRNNSSCQALTKQLTMQVCPMSYLNDVAINNGSEVTLHFASFASTFFRSQINRFSYLGVCICQFPPPVVLSLLKGLIYIFFALNVLELSLVLSPVQATSCFRLSAALFGSSLIHFSIVFD